MAISKVMCQLHAASRPTKQATPAGVFHVQVDCSIRKHEGLCGTIVALRAECPGVLTRAGTGVRVVRGAHGRVDGEGEVAALVVRDEVVVNNRHKCRKVQISFHHRAAHKVLVPAGNILHPRLEQLELKLTCVHRVGAGAVFCRWPCGGSPA